MIEKIHESILRKRFVEDNQGAFFFVVVFVFVFFIGNLEFPEKMWSFLALSENCVTFSYIDGI